MVDNRTYLIHPLYILITLVLGSVTSLFLGFSGAYIYSRVQSGLEPVAIPSLFFINTIFLIGSSLALIQTKKAYETDNTRRYKQMLWVTLLLTITFLVLQILAWNQMYQMNLEINSKLMGSYLYAISGLHFTHVIAGIPFLVFFIHDARKRLVEPASVLIYLSDPDKKRKLTVLSIYWHFLDGLWIYLILFFLINKII